MTKTQCVYDVHQTDGTLCGTISTMADLDEIFFEQERLVPLRMVALMLGVEEEYVDVAYEEAESEEEWLTMVAFLIAHELVDQWLNDHMDMVARAKGRK